MDIILICGIILVISALSCKTAGKIGLPTLVGFIIIGVIIGNWFKFEDMVTVDRICNFALLLIIFTGGFQTHFKKAKPVLALSSVLSVGGTLLTTLFAGVFAHFVLRLDILQSMLLGAVISSTDVASVFSVLRSKQVGLKSNLNYVLEIESGSNEPFAHILTLVLIALAIGSQNVSLMLVQQIVVGVISGVVFAKLGQFLINWLNVEIDGLYGALLCGTAFLIFGAAEQFGGSGFLAVYIGGIIIGNGKLVHKGSLSKLYSAISMLMQITLFIILGILCVPSAVAAVAGNAFLFALFLFFIARPFVMFMLMKPFGRPLNEIALVSWAGFRGASSIVFATHLLSVGLPYAEYVFSVTFFVCMMSVILQSSFIIPISRKLRLSD
ncbi:MAG: potassium/proton antiporter [Chitinispirillales bacterium]|nr:potassium/proton antiporter [Chitinispirillales bacterium]